MNKVLESFIEKMYLHNVDIYMDAPDTIEEDGKEVHLDKEELIDGLFGKWAVKLYEKLKAKHDLTDLKEEVQK